MQCHMPVTVYMQRHPRHDHGFTIPDPWLTVQFGIPNACNRCHTGESPQWALEHSETWYGPRLARPARSRTAAIVRARAGDPEAWADLLRALDAETNGYWRAVLVQFLGAYLERQPVQAVLGQALVDSRALVRLAAVRAAEEALNRGRKDAAHWLGPLLSDPTRSVRVAAAWALRATVPEAHPAARELQQSLRFHADQPWGQFQTGLHAWDRGQLPEARAAWERAIAWDPRAVPARMALATLLSATGQAWEAVRHLQEACNQQPRHAELHFRLGLAWNEAGDLSRAAEALAEATRLEPRHVAAWYNLGLAKAALGDLTAALESLWEAERLDAHDPRIPYARATVLARAGRWTEARQAALRARQLGLDTPELHALLRQTLPRP